MRSLGLAVALAVFAADAAAQVPKDIEARIKEIGPVLNPDVIDEMYKVYGPLMPKAPAGATIKEDVAYGPEERQKLHVFAPQKSAGRAVPVGIFVSRGGVVAGAERRAGTPLYQKVGSFFSRD